MIIVIEIIAECANPFLSNMFLAARHQALSFHLEVIRCAVYRMVLNSLAIARRRIEVPSQADHMHVDRCLTRFFNGRQFTDVHWIRMKTIVICYYMIYYSIFYT